MHYHRLLRFAGNCASAALLMIVATSADTFAAPPDNAQGKGPITIEKMGSFFVGGTVITAPGTFDPSKCGTSCPTPDGQTLHVDHTYVQYRIPPNARKLPLVMWHGCLSTAWESTPDDREGYESLFLRRGFSVYILDQPRMGRAGKSSQGVTLTPTPGELSSFTGFRLGIWPNFFPGVQFPRDAASLDHFWRQGGAGNGPSNTSINVDAIAAIFTKIGPAVLITHSASGGPGWMTALKNSNVKAIVAYEPGSPTAGGYLFPVGEVPPNLSLPDGVSVSPGSPVPLSDFLKLTKIPIQVIMGDNMPTTPDPAPVRDQWRLRLIFAQQFVDAVNRHGGDAALLHLPDIGVYGNTHFAFSDLNNVQIADLLSDFLKSKGLDKRGPDADKEKGAKK